MTENETAFRQSAGTDATLLIFTLSPETERKRRRLLPQGAASTEESLYAETIQHLVESGLHAGTKVIITSPDPIAGAGATYLEQPSGTFQERLGAAVRAVQIDPQPLIVVPSDVPSLSAKHIAHAARAITQDSRKVVLGPSPDGGIYLIASSHPMDEWISEVRWRSTRVLKDLLRVLARDGFEVELLEPLTDLDTRAALEISATRPLPAGSALERLFRLIRHTFLEAKRCLFLPALIPSTVSARRVRSPRAPPPSRF